MNLYGKSFEEINIESTPTGATVYINGKIMGKTPLKKKIDSSAKVVISKNGFKSISQKLSPKKSSYHFTLVRKKCLLFIQSTPKGATIKLNGKNVGKTPKKLSLDGGKNYNITVSHKDKKIVFKETITPKDNLNIVAELRDKEELKKIEYDKVFSENRKDNKMVVAHSFKSDSKNSETEIPLDTILKKYLSEITECFFKEFKNKTDIPAEINISYQIYPNGKVHKVTIEDSNYKNKEDSLNFCVIYVFQKIQFPKLNGVKNGKIPISFSFE